MIDYLNHPIILSNFPAMGKLIVERVAIDPVVFIAIDSIICIEDIGLVDC